MEIPVFDKHGWQLVEYNTELRRGLWALVDQETNSILYQVRYDVEDVLSDNDRERNDAPDPRVSKIGEWNHVASVPVGKFHADLDEACENDDDKYIRRYLSDPDNRRFRTSRTRL